MSNRRSTAEITAARNLIVAGLTTAPVSPKSPEAPGQLATARQSDLDALVREGRIVKTVRKEYDSVPNRSGKFGGVNACVRHRAFYSLPLPSLDNEVVEPVTVVEPTTTTTLTVHLPRPVAPTTADILARMVTLYLESEGFGVAVETGGTFRETSENEQTLGEALAASKKVGPTSGDKVWVASKYSEVPQAHPATLIEVGSLSGLFVAYEADGHKYETPLDSMAGKVFPTPEAAIAAWYQPEWVAHRQTDKAFIVSQARQLANQPKYTGD